MNFVWDFLTQQGVNVTDIQNLKHTALVLLMLPFVITISGIFRYIIGFKSLNIYITTILTFAFFELGFINDSFSFGRGLFYGLFLLVITFITSTLLYSLLKRSRMHYVPKLSIIITIVSIVSLLMIIVSVLLDRNRFVAISPVVLVMMVVISEGFMAILAKKSFRYAVDITLETLLICIISYILISLQIIQETIMTYPVIVLAVIIFNIYVGGFTGLRLMEYWRFRSIIFNNQDNNNDKPRTDQKK